MKNRKIYNIFDPHALSLKLKNGLVIIIIAIGILKLNLCLAYLQAIWRFPVISPRTVKQHLRTLFLRAGIRDGRKRVKLATAAFTSEVRS